MAASSTYQLFCSLLWLAEQHQADRDAHGLSVTVAVLGELALEDRVASQLAHSDRLRSRWDRVFAATDPECAAHDPGAFGSSAASLGPAALAESLVHAGEVWLEDGDFEAVQTLIPKLALLESVHGVVAVFPTGEMRERVDALRMASKDWRVS